MLDSAAGPLRPSSGSSLMGVAAVLVARPGARRGDPAPPEEAQPSRAGRGGRYAERRGIAAWKAADRGADADGSELHALGRAGRRARRPGRAGADPEPPSRR